MIGESSYAPPFSLTTSILNLVADISEIIGRTTVQWGDRHSPRLRRENRIRTIQASLAIENNSLNLQQVTAIIAGKRVLGHPREIQEVRNAYAAYEAMSEWDACALSDLLGAHGTLMAGLNDEAGRFRSGDVGIFRGEQLIHLAPPAHRVPQLMQDLFTWLRLANQHPLVASCIVHYEIEFIHPFSDGNGRIGRLWQTLVLRSWKPLLANIPTETVIRDQQEEYYEVLASADRLGDITPFIEFLLHALRTALRDAVSTDQVSDHVSDQVASLLQAIGIEEIGSSALMEMLGLAHRPTFRKNYLEPALREEWIERTQPDSLRSPTQKYRLTEKGLLWLRAHSPTR